MTASNPKLEVDVLGEAQEGSAETRLARLEVPNLGEGTGHPLPLVI